MSTRPYLAQLHRGDKTLWKRSYQSFTNAARRATELALLQGEPGDVMEFSNNDTGFQIGTMKLHVGGSLTLEWSPAAAQIQRFLAEYKEQHDGN